MAWARLLLRIGLPWIGGVGVHRPLVHSTSVPDAMPAVQDSEVRGRTITTKSTAGSRATAPHRTAGPASQVASQLDDKPARERPWRLAPRFHRPPAAANSRDDGGRQTRALGAFASAASARQRSPAGAWTAPRGGVSYRRRQKRRHGATPIDINLKSFPRWRCPAPSPSPVAHPVRLRALRAHRSEECCKARSATPASSPGPVIRHLTHPGAPVRAGRPGAILSAASRH